ncbi:MAG: S-layer homology domain-containing protein [Peptococcaceae bacterium]|nr:S-layer homology domain-containing protein [Peptococcaceae bacterium]
MQTMMKHRKAIAFVLTLAILFSIVPAAAWADDSQPVQNTVQLMHTKADMTTAQALMMKIAQSNVDSTNEWMIMDMAAYHALNPDSPKTTDAAKQAYINKAIASITDTAGETTLSKAVIILSAIGINPAELYPANSEKKLSAVAKLKECKHDAGAWVAPYTMAAYRQNRSAISDKEQALVQAVLDTQYPDGRWEEWGDSIQTTSNMITGLAFYYDSDESVKAAVDKAITYLSTQQKDDGSFDAYGYGADSNTAAMVVIALAAAGINPDTDDRFIKNGISVYDNLLSYAYSDNSGFGYQDNQSDPWGSSTEQGFRALLAASQVMNTGKSFNVYDFSANSLTPGRATGIGEVSKPSTPSGSSNVTVTVSIKGLDGYWLKEKAVTLKDDATMYWALVDAIKGSDITQTGAENGYVSEMSNGKTTLAEFDYGRNSGWLYKVNNTLPEVGLLQYTVKNGDKIEWYYTKDWTTDSLAGGRVNDTDKKAAASVDELLDKLLKDLGSLDNITADDAEAVAQIRKAYDALTDEQKALVKGYDDLVAAEAMLEALLGETEELPFADIENHWAGNSIRFVYENGLMRGVSDTDFAPDATFSRAMLVAVLHRMAGEPAANGAYPFADVRDTAWYANPVAWAYQNKLAGGMTETQYAPNAPITREQLAVMLMRFAQYMDYDTADTIRLVHYKDAGSVSGYAEGAVKWAVANGILKGRNLNELAPQGTATRAEVAVMLERFVNLYTADKQA